MTLLKNIFIKTPIFLILTLLILGWTAIAFTPAVNVSAQVGGIANSAGNSPSSGISSTASGTCGNGALASFQILPFCSIFDLLNAVVGFLRQLAIPTALLVITWGGYQYFTGGFDGKSDGLKAIQAGVIGLAIILSAGLIIDITQKTFTSTGFNVTPLINAIISPATNTLVILSSAVALLVITWGGYRYFIGGIDGKSEGIKNIQSGIIGLIVVLTANFIVSAVNNVFKDATTSTDFGAKAKNFIEPILTQGLTFLTSLASIAAVLVIVWGGYKYFFSTLPGSKEDGKKNIELGITGLVVVIIAKPIVTIVNSTIGVQNNQLSLDPQSLIYTAQVIITNFLIPISSVITVGLFIWAGYLWITSAGDAGTVKKARDSFYNAIIGLIVVLMAVTITQLIVFFVKTDKAVKPTASTNSSSVINSVNNGNSSSAVNTGNATQPSLPTNSSTIDFGNLGNIDFNTGSASNSSGSVFVDQTNNNDISFSQNGTGVFVDQTTTSSNSSGNGPSCNPTGSARSQC